MSFADLFTQSKMLLYLLQEKDTLGSTMYMVGRDAKTGKLVGYIDSCSMCKRVVINAGIDKVIVKDENTKEGYRIINVQDWIDYDEVLEKKLKR